MLPICVRPQRPEEGMDLLKLKLQEVVSCPVRMCGFLRSKVQKEMQGRNPALPSVLHSSSHPDLIILCPSPQVLLGETVPLLLLDQE